MGVNRPALSDKGIRIITPGISNPTCADFEVNFLQVANRKAGYHYLQIVERPRINIILNVNGQLAITSIVATRMYVKQRVITSGIIDDPLLGGHIACATGITGQPDGEFILSRAARRGALDAWLESNNITQSRIPANLFHTSKSRWFTGRRMILDRNNAAFPLHNIVTH